MTRHGKTKRSQPTRVTKPKITGAWPSEERGAAKVIALPVVKVVIAPIGLDSLPGPCVRGPGSLPVIKGGRSTVLVALHELPSATW